ncbi:MAG: hypothetical protein Q8Q41_01490, partial [bacterium]|nr:hypothetical protein [bacterium]
MKGGAKKTIAIILLASTAVASGMIVRSGGTVQPGASASLPENVAPSARYESVSRRLERGPANGGGAQASPVLRAETTGEARTNTRKPGRNQTELLAQSLAKEIIKRNPNGPELVNDSSAITIPTEEALNRIIDERAAQFDPKQLLAVVRDEDIKIVAGRSAPALERYLDKSLVGVEDALQKLALPKNGFSEEDVKKLAAAYGEIAERLAALSVPEDLAPFHKKELELFLTQKNFLDAVLGYAEDPLGTIVVAKYGDFYVQQTERNLLDLEDELKKFSDEKLSLYSPDEAKSIAERIFLIERAYAVVPTMDLKAILAIIKSMVANIMEWVRDAARWAADKAWIMAVEALKKRLLDMLVDQIVQWVQGGGSPKFITDWQGFLRDAFNAGVGDVVKQLGLGFLCSPFNLQVKLALSPIPKFSQRASCTLDKIVSNIQNFYKDFRNGGWIAYQTQWQPAGNYYGSVLMAYDEAITEGMLRKEAAKNQGIADQGFLSTKRCVQRAYDEMDRPTGECLKYEITTPGKTIGDTLSKAIGSDIDYIVNSRDLSAYIAAIANAIINRLVREGVSGVAALLTPSAPSGGYIPSGGATGPCAGISGPALDACRSYQNTIKSISAAGKQPMLDVISRILPEKQGTLNQKRASLFVITQPTTGIVDLLVAL